MYICARKYYLKFYKMKKLLFVFAFMSLLFTACEQTPVDNNDEPNNSGNTSEAIRLTSQGVVSVGCGNSMGFITYELVAPAEGIAVEATSNVDWIGNFDYKQMGKIMYNIEQNPLEEPREGVITVSYGKSSFTVTIKQAENPAPTEKTITDFMLLGKYYGIQSGLYNYYLIFADLGLDSSNMYNVPNAHYYFVDLFLDEAPADTANVTIPVGVYDFDKSSSGFADTFTDTYSWYQINDASGNASSQNQISYETGKLTVEEGKVTLDITLVIDDVMERHIVVYEGDYSFINEA